MKHRIYSYQGLGDNFFQRPFVRACLARGEEVWLDSSWPQLYWDMGKGLHFINPHTPLRTQARNAARADIHYEAEAEPYDEVSRFRYLPDMVQAHGSITKVFESQVPLFGQPYDYGFSVPADWLIAAQQVLHKLGLGRRCFAIVRPNTYRKEWLNYSRAPKAEYLAACCRYLQRRGFAVLSIADLVPQVEWLDGLMPADTCAHAGEFSTEALIGAVSLASGVVGGIGFLQPMALAVGTPAFMVYGGFDSHHTWKGVTDSRMPLKQLYGHVEPDEPCMCGQMQHRCAKDIPPTKLLSALDEWLERAVRPSTDWVTKPKVGAKQFISDMQAYQTPDPMAEPRIVMCSLTDANMAMEASVSFDNKRAYCAAHKYAFVGYDHLIDESRPAAWNKIQALYGVLTHKARNCEWVFWSDCDSVICNPHIKLESLLIESGEYSGQLVADADLIITRDKNGLNSGQFMLRNCPASLEFLKRLWAQEDLVHADRTPEHPFWDQSAFNRLIKTGQAGVRIRYIPQNIINAYPETLAKGERPFILHFPGRENRAWLMAGALQHFARVS